MQLSNQLVAKTELFLKHFSATAVAEDGSNVFQLLTYVHTYIHTYIHAYIPVSTYNDIITAVFLGYHQAWSS